MSDEMDECACFWSHEFAMRRLLALLRNGQAYCTDTECIDLPLSGANPRDADDGNNFAFVSMLMIFAVILYVFRPNSMRRLTNGNEKQSSQPPNDRQDPDDAPPAIN